MSVKLSDGTELLIRPISPSDKAQLAAGMKKLSERTIHRRFLGPKPGLSKAELRFLTEVDGHNHFAIVAETLGGQIVAVARWVRFVSDDQAAEAAIVVADRHQGKGLGKQLARMLADAARAHGVRRMHANMLSVNPPAHALLRVISERLSAGSHEYGAHEVVADLAA
jgi:protein lysine acetyltransferase